MLKSLSDITPVLQEQIEACAGCFFTPVEIALMLEIEESFFQENVKSPGNVIHRAFNKGWLQAEFDVRKCIMQLAKSGSSPAQTAAMDLRNKAKIKMLDQ